MIPNDDGRLRAASGNALGALKNGGAVMERLVVVGNGMAGVACVDEILKHTPKFEITIFGDETQANYNRIMLSSVLADEKEEDNITLNGPEWYQKHGIQLRLGVRITDVHARSKIIRGNDGSVTAFDKLLLATGSAPFIPRIEGLEKQGVFTFRTLDYTRKLLETARSGRKAVVIGGGLLGPETARGLEVQGCDVTVVHLVDTLMNAQLDRTGGDYLKKQMERLGVRVLLEKSTQTLLGNGSVQGLMLTDGETIETEIVVIAAGICPNVDLGRRAGLKVNRGIVVNDHMEISNPGIFAVGECVEHRGVVYGLVDPLFEQGRVLAATITGNRGARYEGRVRACR